MELKDVEFTLNDEGENEAFCKVTDDLELQIIKENKVCYGCYLWNNSCARDICLGEDLDQYQTNDIIICLTH